MKRRLIITVVFTIFLLISWTFFIHMIMLQLMSLIFFLKFFGLNTLFDRHFVVQFEFFFHFSKRVITRMAIELFEFLSNEVRHSFYSLLSILIILWFTCFTSLSFVFFLASLVVLRPKPFELSRFPSDEESSET